MLALKSEDKKENFFSLPSPFQLQIENGKLPVLLLVDNV